MQQGFIITALRSLCIYRLRFLSPQYRFMMCCYEGEPETNRRVGSLWLTGKLHQLCCKKMKRRPNGFA